MGRGRTVIIGESELRAKITALGAAVRKANDQAGRAGGDFVAEAAKLKEPGAHVMSLESKLNSNDNQVTVDIGPDKDHYFYQFIETGATAHEIKAGRGARRAANLAAGGKASQAAKQKATAGARLVFEGRAGLVVTGSVQHPGMKARPFMRPALNNNRDKVQDICGMVFKEEIDKLCDDQGD